MNAIRIHKTLETATPGFPEFSPFIGKSVEIIVIEDSNRPTVSSPKDNIEKLSKLIEQIRGNYDFNAVQEQRDYDILHANDHVL